MKLASFERRDDAHRYLEEVLAETPCRYPRAECREDPNEAEPYQVWSAPMKRVFREVNGVLEEIIVEP